MQALSCIAAKSSYPWLMPNMGRPSNRKRSAFGERLVAAREEAGLSQRELADKLGITQRALSWWERESVALRPEQVAQLATVLGVSTDHLLGVPSTKKRGTGPTGKARRAFEAVSKLPRHHQQKIVDVVETFVAGHQNGKAA
jgi:transcriptional regulator with XRE-family HTH domain